jgi:SAM-dependent methyltransferase
MDIGHAIHSRFVHALLDGRWDLLRYSLWTRLKRLDLRGESHENMEIDRSRGNEHADSGGPDLARVLRMLDISGADRIVDLGSGKGGAMLTMSRFPFSEILGIDLSERMISIALQNAANLGVKKVSFICTDAADFRDLDRFTYVYMFNPFPAHVIREVMLNLAASALRLPRKITLIYKYPGCPDELVDRAIFPNKAVFQYKGSHPFSIYTTRTSCAGGRE